MDCSTSDSNDPANPEGHKHAGPQQILEFTPGSEPTEDCSDWQNSFCPWCGDQLAADDTSPDDSEIPAGSTALAPSNNTGALCEHCNAAKTQSNNGQPITNRKLQPAFLTEVSTERALNQKPLNELTNYMFGFTLATLASAFAACITITCGAWLVLPGPWNTSSLPGTITGALLIVLGPCLLKCFRLRGRVGEALRGLIAFGSLSIGWCLLVISGFSILVKLLFAGVALAMVASVGVFLYRCYRADLRKLSPESNALSREDSHLDRLEDALPEPAKKLFHFIDDEQVPGVTDS